LSAPFPEALALFAAGLFGLAFSKLALSKLALSVTEGLAFAEAVLSLAAGAAGFFSVTMFPLLFCVSLTPI
jgi:hypothetical protein